MVYKVFVDTNVIFEHALERNSYKDVIEVFKLAEEKKIECFSSVSSFYTMSYVLRKRYSDKHTRLILQQYLSFISVLSTDEKQFSIALASSFKDIEDAFQYYTALEKTDYLLTFNKKDFTQYSLAQLEVCTPGEFLKLIS